jgi:hypothetical protein
VAVKIMILVGEPHGKRLVPAGFQASRKYHWLLARFTPNLLCIVGITWPGQL